LSVKVLLPHPLLVAELAFPPLELNPNARVHRHAKATVVKRYRQDAAAVWAGARNARGRQGLPLDGGTLWAHFYEPDRRKRDGDNLLAALKPAIDGMVDAGILVDDDALDHLPICRELDRDRPRVRLLLFSGRVEWDSLFEESA
jgi:crossover junction endodeoxyribonuclease RusA